MLTLLLLLCLILKHRTLDKSCGQVDCDPLKQWHQAAGYKRVLRRVGSLGSACTMHWL